ncbi:mechanosensitive ion channel [Jeotgalibaca caeni]|uniref:mechanosensitive ion channel n=1 Tax=Jeotgalibaca caeni TaxID=3028623 RepID=UPI00237E400E|nr:mechanosensitive ion channel [Jeotgalibaca caeni]MDE1548080.1 mechanosensitive ion channel [Jeotgalibaca caeni]
MNGFTNSLEGLLTSFLAFLPRLLGALLLVVLAWVLASVVKKGIVKGLQALNFNQKLTKWGVATTTDDGNRMIESIGKVFYYLIWLFFIPGILAQIGMANIAAPITNMFDSFLAFLPKLFGAAVILAIGYFIAKFVKELVQNLLETMNIDRFLTKYNEKTNTPVSQIEGQRFTVARVLANTVFVLILIPVITMALETLQIRSISEPIVNVLNQVLAAIPNILVAIILLIAGGLIAKVIGDLLEGLLANSGINKYSRFLSTGPSSQVRLSNVIAKIVQTVVVVFFVVEALNALNLEILNQIGIAIIAYLPSVLIGLIILGLGIFGGNALSAFIKDSTGSTMTGEVVKYLLYILAIFMTLDQLQFASSIVNTAFLFIIGGLAVAFALAFGLGGREFAKRQLDKFDRKIEEESNKVGTGDKTETEKAIDPTDPNGL